MNWKRVICLPSYVGAELALSAISGYFEWSWGYFKVWQHGAFGAVPIQPSGIPAFIVAVVVFVGLTAWSVLRPSLLWPLLLVPFYAIWFVFGRSSLTGNIH